MTTREIQTQELAIKLMTQHGLIDKGWTFAFSNKKRAAGTCSYRRKQITISRYLLPHFKEEKTKDTILHEIAHAIAGSHAGHGWEWKRVARQIGADPTRCYDGEKEFSNESKNALATQSKYKLECPNCGKVVPIHRRPKRSKACGDCCNKHAGGRYDERFKLILHQNY